MAIASFNKVIIGGRLGRDPEIHTFEGGDRVARLSIATTEQWTSGGTRQEKTDWHTAALFKKARVTSIARNNKAGPEADRPHSDVGFPQLIMSPMDLNSIHPGAPSLALLDVGNMYVYLTSFGTPLHGMALYLPLT